MRQEKSEKKPRAVPGRQPSPHGDKLAPTPAKARHHEEVEEVAEQMIDAAEAPPNGPLEG